MVIVNGHAVVGGAESWLLQLLDATDRLEPSAVVFQRGLLVAELRRRGIDTSVHEVGRQPWHLALPMLRLAASLRRQLPDVVLANGFKAATVAVPAARLAGIPVVWARHDHMYEVTAGPLARLADGVVGAVEEVVEAMRRRDAVVVPPPRPEVPPCGREEARRYWRALGVPLDQGPVVAMVGRLVPYKGVDDAVRAVAAMDDDTWRLAVVGEDDPASPGERDRLEALARALGVGERVVFTGSVADAGHWLAGFDALAVLTRPAGFRTPPREGFGTSAFEAMLAGVPVVALDGGAVARRLAGEAGIVVPTTSPGTVADALRRLEDPAVRDRMGRAGQRLMAGHPDVKTCAGLLVGELAAAARRPGAGLHTGPAVSVITTVKDEAEAVERLLDAVVPQLLEHDELVLVDGGSSDETVERAVHRSALDPRVRVVEAPGAGISAGRNVAVTQAVNEHLVSTDAGCHPHAGWVEALRLGLGDQSSPALVTGLYHVAARGHLEEAFALACYPAVEEARRLGPWGRAYGALLGRVYDPTLPTGRSMGFTREAWRMAGGFPEDLGTAEDVRFGRALVEAGGRAVLASDAVVTWYQRPGLRSTARMYHSYGFGDGRSGDPLLVGRNLVRASAYGLGAVLASRGPWAARALVAAAGAVYLSLPLARARHRAAKPATWALLPVALAVKDLAKASGCLRALASRS